MRRGRTGRPSRHDDGRDVTAPASLNRYAQAIGSTEGSFADPVASKRILSAEATADFSSNPHNEAVCCGATVMARPWDIARTTWRSTSKTSGGSSR